MSSFGRPDRSSNEETHADDSQSEGKKSSSTEPSLANEAATRPSRRKRRGMLICIFVCIAVIVLALALDLGLGLGLRGGKQNYNHKGHNVLVIMTDDQDLHLDSMQAMPNVKRLIGEQGVTYEKHYCTVAWCCPSRVNFLTGRAAHNTNVTALSAPYGGWPKFLEQGLNDNWLPVWIKDAGIRTYYVGKLMNSYAHGNFDNPHPKGLTDSSFLMDPWTYNYYNSHWSDGYSSNVNAYKGEHTTDVTQKKALAMLDDAASSGDQFFMMVAPVAPHMELSNGLHPPPVPDAFKDNFTNAIAPRTGNFNPEQPSGASWVKAMPRQSEADINYGDVIHRKRLGNVLAIDSMVEQLIQKLDDYGQLENTYIMYTTDNGFHIGNHRLPAGKRCPYEEDINIPFLMRGPGIPKGVVSNITNSHTDAAPTILQMLGVPLKDNFDGAPIAYTQDSISKSNKSEMVNVEFWSGHGAPNLLTKAKYFNNTYKALRLQSDDHSLYYSTWCTGEHEFYDMNNDFIQMNNWLSDTPKPEGSPLQYYGRPQSELIHRLDALLMVTKTCKQDSCRVPWSVLFPRGEVDSLQEAMKQEYDLFFLNQPKITFSACHAGNILEYEGELNVNAFGGHAAV